MTSYYRSSIDFQRSLVHSFEQSTLLHAIDTDDVKVIDNLALDILRALGNEAHSKATIEAVICKQIDDETIGSEDAGGIFNTLLSQQLLCPAGSDNES